MKSALFTKSYKYRAADGAHFDDAEAEVIGRELEQAPGFPRLTPEIVVSVAKSPASALHRHFEWDDPSAAVLYRKEQARRILRDLIIIDARAGQSTRAYQNFTKEESEESRAYVHASEIVRRPVLADTLLDRAYSEMERWIERYGRLEEVFEPLVDAWQKIKRRRRTAA